jgi:hypothetical protein
LHCLFFWLHRQGDEECQCTFLIHSSNSCKLFQGIPGTVRSYYVKVSKITEIRSRTE